MNIFYHYINKLDLNGNFTIKDQKVTANNSKSGSIIQIYTRSTKVYTLPLSSNVVNMLKFSPEDLILVQSIYGKLHWFK